MKRVARNGWAIPPQYWQWLGARTTRAIALWLIALAIGGGRLWTARQAFAARAGESPQAVRADGNGGHMQIDFGGQWVMGRMLVEGHGRELYHRNRQWQVVRAAYPVSAESPECRLETIVPPESRTLTVPKYELLRHDADWLMHWFMGQDSRCWTDVGGAVAAGLVPSGSPFGFAPASIAVGRAALDRITPITVACVSAPAIGGPLYPPTQAFFMAPLALDDAPQRSYHICQLLLLGITYFAALGVSALSRGRIWWSVASAAILLYPGCRGGLDLAQNPSVTLAIVAWGWVLASRGREGWGGAVWGLLAFKPTWAAAFVLVPLLGRRWRFLSATVAVGASLCLATVPFVGVQSWRDWLQVGREATDVYDVSQNWNFLSRDLQGIPRRFLLDFGQPESVRSASDARLVGWALWGTVVGSTVAVFLAYGRRRQAVGAGAAFLFFGAFLACYRFMYYDALLSAAGVAALVSGGRRFRRPTTFSIGEVRVGGPADGWAYSTLAPPTDPSKPRMRGYVSSLPLTALVLLWLQENFFAPSGFLATVGVGYLTRATTGAEGNTGLTNRLLEFDSSTNYPWDTFLVLALWAWCGLRLIVGARRRARERTPIHT